MNRLIHFQCKGLRKISGATSKFRLAVLLAVAVVMLQGIDAQANFAGISGLSVNGDVTFDSGSLDIVGTPTIAGEFWKTVAGSTDSSSFDQSGVTGGDPVSQAGTLTQSGDGFGIDATVSGSDTSEVYPLGLDITMDLSNTSAISQLITIHLDFSNSVDADGIDAYADSSFFLEKDEIEFFFTDLTSDTLYGDIENGSDLITYGALLSDSGNLSWDITLDPGQSMSLFGAFSLYAGAYDDPSNFTGDFSAELTVSVIPEPSSILLASIGCFSILMKKRKMK